MSAIQPKPNKSKRLIITMKVSQKFNDNSKLKNKQTA